MFHLNQAALLSIQLLVVSHVFAGTHSVDQRNILVFRGDYIMFTCNISMNNASQISWSKDRFLFSHALLNNLTFSNFTSHRFILTSVIGFLLCGITAAVCLCRKHMSRSPAEKLYDNSTLSIAVSYSGWQHTSSHVAEVSGCTRLMLLFVLILNLSRCSNALRVIGLEPQCKEDCYLTLQTY
ncbi:uncharacterized protein AKAME5_002397100 [Lates japonicus]|uniref:Ig-like domain-containing protein n=1 Tax=Lates japonicus TaxID=270547 RepID=A0AAD3RLC7_LATJO|nr:uncharacterized protein AKAME5_002397100 [Lates japonicus]